ncbi:MAG: hypothetical protein ACD_16C00087G0004 [uncultured bacterium]|nr:MAG: hypothetical protein ACD_16C00087G0004 [uncultured bacterium]
MFLEIVSSIIVMIMKIFFIADDVVIKRFIPFEFGDNDLIFIIFFLKFLSIRIKINSLVLIYPL